MYKKNKSAILLALQEHKEGIVNAEQILQFLQNIISEEIERKDLPEDKYEVDENNVDKSK